MGRFSIYLQIGNVTEALINTVKTALDAQIAIWRCAYPTLAFSRGAIDWKEDGTFINVSLQIGDVGEGQINTVKTAIDAQIASWQTTYPTLAFSRGTINWRE